MPSLEGLNLVNQVNKGINDNNAQISRQSAAQQAAELFKQGDIKGAYAAMAAVDPEHATTSFGQFQQLDPSSAGQLNQAKAEGAATGELTGQTPFGANPRQMLDAQLANREEVAGMQAKKAEQSKSEAAKEKNQDRNENWQTQMWNKVTISEPFKNFQNFKSKQATLENAAKNPSAFGDIGSVFAFMKTLDPQSVVRESEYATAAEAGSLLTRVQNSIGKAETGKQLTPEQRQDMLRLTKHLGDVYKQNYDEFLRPVKQQAVKRGVDIDLIDPYNVQPDGSPGMKQSAVPANNSQNQEALAWIKANPKDPRAAAIRAKLGLK